IILAVLTNCRMNQGFGVIPARRLLDLAVLVNNPVPGHDTVLARPYEMFADFLRVFPRHAVNPALHEHLVADRAHSGRVLFFQVCTHRLDEVEGLLRLAATSAFGCIHSAPPSTPSSLSSSKILRCSACDSLSSRWIIWIVVTTSSGRSPWRLASAVTSTPMRRRLAVNLPIDSR